MSQNFDASQIEDAIENALRKRDAGKNWLAWAHVAVTVAIMPWGVWVTKEINRLDKKDGEFAQWQEGRDTVLQNQKLQLLHEVSGLMENRLGQIQGRLDTISKQTSDNGYELRLLSSKIADHLSDTARRNPLTYPPSAGTKNGDAIAW